MEDALVLCRRCPVMLEVVYQAGPASVMGLYRIADQAIVVNFLAANALEGEIVHSEKTIPLHTSRYSRHYERMATYLREVRPQPLALAHYSATTGNRLPAGSMVPTTFWHDILCTPVLLHPVLQRVVQDNFPLITHVGPHPFLTGRAQKKSFHIPDTCAIVDSMRYRSPELTLFRQTYRTLRWSTWLKRLPRPARGQSRSRAPASWQA